MLTRKRKPLADITNNPKLTPIDDLRKLNAPTVKSSSISKHPNHILKSNFNSTNYKSVSGADNRSEVGSASIGSSNISSTRNSRTVQFQAPSVSPGFVVSKDTANYGRQNVEKPNNGVDPDVVISPTAAEKRRAKGKSVAVPFCTPHPRVIRNDENALSNRLRLLKESKIKDKANPSPHAYPTHKVKEYVKGIPNPSSCSYGKMDKGKTVVNYSGNSEEKMEDEMGKGISNYSSSSLENTIAKKKGILKPYASIVKSTGGEILGFSGIVIERNKEKVKALSTFGSSHPKASDKGKGVLSDAANHPSPRNNSVTAKMFAGTSSCPPMPKTKIIDCDLDGTGSTQSSSPWTDFRPAKKKRCPRNKEWEELPSKFVEQQKAYFDEVDAFELAVEEVSEGELD